MVIDFMSTGGYLHSYYAQSLSEFGDPVRMPNCGGWIIKRPIPGTDYYDGMGCYPIFCCNQWEEVEKDIGRLAESLVCLSLVTDPFSDCSADQLSRIFKDVCYPFKEHYVIDLSVIKIDMISKNHVRNIHKALKEITIELCVPTPSTLATWITLYDHLIQRHNIHGIAKFSPHSFEMQFKVPGLTIFRAQYNGETIGMVLWYAMEDRVYYHLGAYNLLGYEKFASFGIFWQAIQHFKNIGYRWINLGGAAGINQKSEDGLARFKSGWATGTKITYFCGKILQPDLCYNIIKQKQISPSRYFPAYRQGEFSQ